MMRNSGFTLLEMLLALTVMVMISIASWQILSTVNTAARIQAEHQQRLDAIDHALLILRQDILQLLDRGVRVDGKVSANSLFEGVILDSDDDGLTFVRAGWANPGHLLPRSELQRVYYRLKGGRLERGYDQILDKPVSGPPAEYRVLLEDLLALEFLFHFPRPLETDGSEGEWLDYVPDKRWPDAIAIRMEIEAFGRVEHRMIIPEKWGAIYES